MVNFVLNKRIIITFSFFLCLYRTKTRDKEQHLRKRVLPVLAYNFSTLNVIVNNSCKRIKREYIFISTDIKCLPKQFNCILINSKYVVKLLIFYFCY